MQGKLQVDERRIKNLKKNFELKKKSFLGWGGMSRQKMLKLFLFEKQNSEKYFFEKYFKFSFFGWKSDRPHVLSKF